MKTFLLKTNFLTTFLLVANLFFASIAFGQTIKTDLDDYPPGATAIISGSGFQAGETVTLLVEHVGTEPTGTDPEHHEPWTVQADANGEIISEWLVNPNGDSLGATFLLTAKGSLGSDAEWNFTDGNLAISTDLLNKAVYCASQEMVIYFSTTGIVAGFNSSFFLHK